MGPAARRSSRSSEKFTSGSPLEAAGSLRGAKVESEAPSVVPPGESRPRLVDRHVNAGYNLALRGLEKLRRAAP
ncbi:MAG: hypothetical protein Kow0069_31890 [Promethearchaeota archaeon]